MSLLPEDEELSEAVEAEPELFLKLLIDEAKKADKNTIEFIVHIAVLATDENVNILRVMNDHPDFVEEHLGERIIWSDAKVGKVDREIRRD